MGLINTKGDENDNDMTFDLHFPTSKNALIIFTRNPELGQCKTRLAKTIGNEPALNIYKHLLKHTARISEPVNADKFVFYSKNIIKNDIWNPDIFKKKLQKGNDLGERMEQAFIELFGLGYHKILIIGSDLLDLNENIINHAFQQLNTNDFVIGPAKDGGYYLLGMNALNSMLFKDKAWGTETVLTDTLKNLQNNNVYLLQELNDIDTFEDMQDFQELKPYYTKHD
ncbi:TIGR04282 family arsenosugar biosynthesis glycosyltransferase [Aestuariibaculum suncheonense]|uniref:TIGR04282 family arsenosugar biosynthesis glycosyltransferase n=1 Tax=Aestuariibaculum suncheonense TaxID=1028745 RepID=A0A8J6Q5S8_9FLAO|nr:TIGR04282 family arsenosugar biosynthesis glycosyltransferase [Aestuariibaculum suncheonense]MBD0834250.1 TIGR04282 family arsenosugar biosynthesis glycosyltransferase [Aestuariibaculum suncheonense]